MLQLRWKKTPKPEPKAFQRSQYPQGRLRGPRRPSASPQYSAAGFTETELHVKAASPFLNPNQLPEGQEGVLWTTFPKPDGSESRSQSASFLSLCRWHGDVLYLRVHSKPGLSVQPADKDVSGSNRFLSYGRVPIGRQSEVTRLPVQSLHGEFFSVTTYGHQLQGYGRVAQEP